MPDDITVDDASDDVHIDQASMVKQELELRIEQIAILQRDLRETQAELSASESETYQLQRRMDDYIRDNLELKAQLQSKGHTIGRPCSNRDVARVDSDLDSDSDLDLDVHSNGKVLNGVDPNDTDSSHLKAEVSYFFFNFYICFLLYPFPLTIFFFSFLSAFFEIEF